MICLRMIVDHHLTVIDVFPAIRTPTVDGSPNAPRPGYHDGVSIGKRMSTVGLPHVQIQHQGVRVPAAAGHHESAIATEERVANAKHRGVVIGCIKVGGKDQIGNHGVKIASPIQRIITAVAASKQSVFYKSVPSWNQTFRGKIHRIGPDIGMRGKVVEPIGLGAQSKGQDTVAAQLVFRLGFVIGPGREPAVSHQVTPPSVNPPDF